MIFADFRTGSTTLKTHQKWTIINSGVFFELHFLFTHHAAKILSIISWLNQCNSFNTLTATSDTFLPIFPIRDRRDLFPFSCHLKH